VLCHAAVFTAVFFFLIPAPILAAPTSIGQDTDITRHLAETAEKQGRWSEACDLYARLLADRTDPGLKQRYQHCLRQCHRQYRTGDPSFISHVLNPQFKLAEAFEFYKDVVRKVQEFYVNSDRVQLTRLFHEGIEELWMDLGDSRFCKDYLKPTVTAAEIDEFRAALRQRWGNLKINNIGEATEQIRAVARLAGQKLELNSKLVVVELACGACNALDEYSFYMTQGALVMGPQVKDLFRAGMVENEKGIGYIKISGFDDSVVEALDLALPAMRMDGMDVLILDLRGNPGGSLEAAIQVVERFVPAPQIIASTSGKFNKTYQSYSMQVVDVPMFVLVDANTASAAELVAGALKSHKRAEVIGDKTFGKNLVQKTVPVSQAPFGAMNLTWAQFHLPKPDDLTTHGGIVPTISASGNPDLLPPTALERARMLVPMR
jgi:hypothetical protein